jgi:hypothetical protein
MMATFYCSDPDCRGRWRNFRRKSKASAKCPTCRKPATLLKRVPRGVRAYVLKEFPEHYNVSLGCVVRSRQHHRQLQRERNLQDWEPTRDSPGSQLSIARSKHRERVMSTGV